LVGSDGCPIAPETLHAECAHFLIGWFAPVLGKRQRLTRSALVESDKQGSASLDR
jgi:hypothetical protein